jgi:hypothetical protein
LESLAANYGNTKKRVLQIRQLLSGSTMQDPIPVGDGASRKRRRAWGDGETQQSTATALARILSVTEAKTLVGTSKFNGVARKLVEDTLGKIGSIIDPESILAACDMTGVPCRGYEEIFRTVHKLIRLVDDKLKVVILPRPYKVRVAIIPFTHILISLFVSKFHDAGNNNLLELTVGLVFIF